MNRFMRFGGMLIIAIIFIVFLSIDAGVASADESAGMARYSSSTESGSDLAHAADQADVVRYDGEMAAPEATPAPQLPAGTGKLRLMYTTDTHGQITGMDYQRQAKVSRGLDRIVTMMDKARSEMNYRNYMTFDVGDNIMDYTTDYIYNKDPYAIQPVFKALAAVGYDAITLGNHEFDYGLDYLTEQLNGSGLMEKVVLSNATSKYTGECVYGVENRIIEKEIIDNSGYTRTVKVGLFGAAPPTLSSRTEKSTSSLQTRSFYDTAVDEVAKLKAQGADIIIALAHTGVGSENPPASSANAGYSMTKVDGLDVILGGHQHVYFPDDAYSYLPGYDPVTKLVNGTRFLVMRDSARALGIVDLNLRFDTNGHVTIDSSGYDIRKVTSDVNPDPNISDFMEAWGKKISEASSVKIADIKDNHWTSYLATLEPNHILQTVQNAQRTYVYQYIMKNAPQYADWPIICATRYGMYGNESGLEYGDVTGLITVGRIQDFARYHKCVYAYEITGAQLKEWMEWTASLYQQTNTSQNSQWDDSTISRYVRSGGQSLIANENVREWGNFFWFGGVEYTIDPSRPPRYSKVGKLISGSERITSLTYNGQPIQPDQKFVIACDQLHSSLHVDATNGIYSNNIAGEKRQLQDIVADYLRNLSALPTIDLGECNNWSLQLPDNYRFLMMTGSNGHSTVASSKWFNSTYDTANGYGYYECVAPPKDATDTQAPCVSLLASSYETSDAPVRIKVEADDISGIAEIKWTSGTRSADDANWYNEYAFQYVTDGVVTVDKSGIYTFYVRDGVGNVAVQSIAITNIDPDALHIPTVNKVDNNDDYISGTAQPGTTVNADIGGTIYSEKTDGDGYYIIDIPIQRARTVIKVYVSDSKGRTSSSVQIKVKRVGPNIPTGKASNNSYYVKGNTHDSGVNVYAIVNKQVYVSKKLGPDYYKKCKKYKKKKKIVLTDITVSKTGSYSIKIPHHKPGKTILVYTIDQFGRVSAEREVTVERTCFEPVSRYATYESEKAVFGRIKEGKRGYVTAYYADGERAGGAYSDKYGFFQVPVDRALKEGEEITLYAKYKASDESRSHPAKLTVDDLEDAFDDSEVDINIKKITAADEYVSGRVDYRNAIISVLYDGSYRMKVSDADGRFKIKLKDTPEEDEIITVFARSRYGIFHGIKKKKVVMGPPKPPVIEDVDIDEDTVIVTHKNEVKMYLRHKKVLYKNPKVEYSEENKRYVYTFEKVKDLDLGSKMIAIARNEGGITKSKIFVVTR